MADSPQPGGWIKLYRSALDNGHLQMPDQCWKLFSYLLLRVNHKPGAGCQPGQGWITYRMIQEGCCDPDKPPWAHSTISRALEYLEGKNPTGERYIQRLHTRKGAAQRLSLINWDKHQGESSSVPQEVPLEVPQEVPLEVALEKQEGEEGKEVISSPPAAETTKPPRQRQPRKEKVTKEKETPDPFNVAAQPLVQRLDTWLKAHETSGVGEWPAAVKMVANALKGKGGPPIPAEEAEQALVWGTKDPRSRLRLLSVGALALRDVWAAWKSGGAPAYSSNRYQDHTKIEPTGKSLFEN